MDGGSSRIKAVSGNMHPTGHDGPEEYELHAWGRTLPRVGFSAELEDMSRPPAVSDSACATYSRPAAPTTLEHLPLQSS